MSIDTTTTETELPSARPHAPWQLVMTVQKQQRRQQWLEGALWASAWLVAWLALGVALVGWVSLFWGECALLIGGLGAIGIWLWRGFWLSKKKVGDLIQTARWMGEKQPQLSLDMVSGLELKDASPSNGAFSEALKNAFLYRLAERSSAFEPKNFSDSKPLRPSFRALVASLSVVALAFVLAPTTFKRGARLLFAPASSAAETLREPITGDVEITFRYPAYTGLLERVVSGTRGDISAVKGTEVLLKTQADRDVTRADVIVNGSRVPLVVKNERDLEGRFVLQESGQYHFVFYKKADVPLVEGPPLSIQAEADAAPQLRIVSPGDEVEIEAGQKVTVSYEASDDFGLTQLHLVYRPPGGMDVRLPLKREEGRRAKGTYTWDLSEVSLAPGQSLSYYVEGQDNDGVSGPKTGVSRTHVLKLYSPAEHRRAAVEKAQALWDKLLGHLADRLEGPELRGASATEQLRGAQTTDASGFLLAQEFLDAGQELSKERDAPQEIWAALSNISQSLRKSVQATSSVRKAWAPAEASSSRGKESRSMLVSAVQREVTQTEKDALYLETLLDRQKVKELQELANQLRKDKRQLASLIEQYQKTQDEKVKESVMQEISAMKARINELMQRMSELARGIRDEHLNQEALAEMMEEKDMSSALDDVEKLLREGKADEALAKLQELGMQMDEMFEQLEENEDSLGEEQFPELAEKFQNFTKDLGETVEQQQKLAEQTEAIKNKYKAQQKQRMLERGNALKKELLKKTEEVLKDYRSAAPGELGARADQPLSQALSELEALKKTLEVNDFDLAAESANRAERYAEELAAAAEAQRNLDEAFQNPGAQRQRSKELAGKFAKDFEAVEGIRKKLENLFPPPGSMMSAGDKKKLSELAKKQSQLEQKAQNLQQQMDEMSQMAPVFNQDALSKMDRVQESMGDAAEKLERQDANRGHGDQKLALDELQQFQKQMQQNSSGKGRGKKGGLPMPMFAGQGQGMGQQSREKVEVPDADDSAAPKEFRKDLLDAMKQGAPDKYREQVKRYYEELVK